MKTAHDIAATAEELPLQELEGLSCLHEGSLDV